MKSLSSWIAFGAVCLAASTGTYACGGDDDDSSSAGKGGTGVILEGGSGTGGKGGNGGTGVFPDGGGSGGVVNFDGSFDAVPIGRACAKDSDCGTGLTCITPNSGRFGKEGPPNGYCSAPCGGADGGDRACARVSDAALCVSFGSSAADAWCVLGCGFGPTELTRFNPEKCHGRDDLACGPLFEPTGTSCQNDTTCGSGFCDQGECWNVVPACLPQCNSNNDCGPGLFCNPATGGCSATQPSGKKTGEKCTPAEGDAPDECQGHCIGIVGESGATLTHVCADNCTVLAVPSCGWSGPTGSQKAPAGCLLSSSLVGDNGGPGPGDRGLCLQLCDCNNDCSSPDFVCIGDGNIKNAYNRQGACDLRAGADGGVRTGIACGSDAGSDSGGSGGTDAGSATAPF